MNENPVLSVVICTYNRADLLPFSLEALAKQTLNRDLFEVIVVDNNSTDNTRQVVEDFCQTNFQIGYFFEPKQGLSQARNRGITEAKGKYLAYIDDDARAVPKWAEILLAAFETIVPQPVAVGGKYIPWYEITPPFWFTDDLEMRSWGEKRGFLEGKRAKYGFAGSNMAIRKDILLELGGFPVDEGIMKRNLGEEVDFFLRVVGARNGDANNLFWYEPDMFIYHWTPAKLLTFKFRSQRYFKGGISLASVEKSTFFSQRFFETLAFFLLQPFYLLINILKFNRPLKNNWLRFLQNISYGSGYLQESLRKK